MYFLFHELFDGIIHMLDGGEVSVFDGMNQAVLQVLLDDVLADLVQLALDGCQLDQHIRTVIIVFDHGSDLAEMTDRAGKLIGDLFDLFGIVGMRMSVFHTEYYNPRLAETEN